jgi:hypothetical protein
MMSGYDFYRTYSSLNWHFTSKFDIVKYGLHSKRLSVDGYKKRNDHLKFETYAKKMQSERIGYYFCVANCVHNKSNWIYESYSDADDIYKQWKKYFDAFEYNFKQEMGVLKGVIDKNDTTIRKMLLPTDSWNNPPLLQLLFSGKLSPEFIVTMDSHFQFIDNWYDMYFNIDPYIESKLFTLRKYVPLVAILRKELST